ncbi:hypothetical protein EXN66_Car019494 [Channa argus]|uniref:Uncharacterized protein n=1 Tax=Channa argus TaxID=215402 RepID=A0A6G1QP00_CHAAH|nr:hypothetical protein EXN66_Car019494 [Channa argus]
MLGIQIEIGSLVGSVGHDSSPEAQQVDDDVGEFGAMGDRVAQLVDTDLVSVELQSFTNPPLCRH